MAKDLTAALQALTEAAQGQTSRVDKSLPEPKAVSAIPLRSGSSGPIAGTGAGGIASPLTENDYSMRTFFAEKNVTDSSGLLVLKIKPIKSMRLTDANNALVDVNFAAPP